MKKGKVEKVKGGFQIQPSKEYAEKQAREKRIMERNQSKNPNPTNKEIFDFLQDIADRQSEIYDMLSERQ